LLSFNRNPDPSNNNATVKYTPLEQQVLELKKRHSGMILMIQTAYKYTFFGEDAEVCLEHDFVILVSDTVLLILVLSKLFKVLKNNV
jgi:hypothetical protein